MANKIESLPIRIKVEKEIYNLTLFVTAWDKLCLAYESDDRKGKLMSVVVDNSIMGKYVLLDDLSRPNPIATAKTLDDAVDAMDELIKKYLNGELPTKNEEKESPWHCLGQG